MNLKEVIQHGVQKMESSNLPNPFYGKNIFFYSGCAGPDLNRTQLMGSLGAFSSFPKLTNEIDICIIPNGTVSRISKGLKDSVVRDLYMKLEPQNENGKKSEVSPNSILFLPETNFFSFTKKYVINT